MEHADAFARFYTAEHGQLLTAVRITLGSAHLADDAVDEAFTRAAERWPTVSRSDNPAGWVYRVAINWATSWRRKLALRPTRTAAALDRPHHDPELDVDLVAALAELPLDQREMLVLRYAMGYPVAAVAATLGVAEGTVKSRIHRARQRLIADGSWQAGADDPMVPTDGRDDSEVFDGRA